MSKGKCKSILKLLGLAEQLLFSFPLPNEVVKKYEGLRTIAFSKVGLVSNAGPIWKMQRDVIEILGKKETKMVQTDSVPEANVTLPTVESVDPSLKSREISSSVYVMRLELVSCLESTYVLLSRQQNLLNNCVLSLTQISARLYSLVGKDSQLADGLTEILRKSEQLTVTRDPSSKASIESMEQEQLATVTECKRIETAYVSAMEELARQMKSEERRIEEAVECFEQTLESNNELVAQADQERQNLLTEEAKDKAVLASKVATIKQQLETKEKQQKEDKKLLKKKLKQKLQEKLEAQAQEHLKHIEHIDADKLNLVKTVSAVDESITALRSQYTGQIEELHSQYGQQLTKVNSDFRNAEKTHKAEMRNLEEKLDLELREKNKELAIVKEELLVLSELPRQPPPKPKIAHKETQASPPREEPQNPDQTGLMGIIEEKLQGMYQKYAPSQKTWMSSLARRKEQLISKFFSLTDHIQVLLYLDFLIEYAEKQTKDSLWLAEKLTIVARDNEKIRVKLSSAGRSRTPERKQVTQQLISKVQADMQATSKALQHFEGARDSLLSKLYS